MTKGVIFNCEGVLVDAQRQTARAWEEMCKQWVPEEPLTAEDLRPLEGLKLSDVLRRLIETHFKYRELHEAIKLRTEMQYHAVTEIPLTAYAGVDALLDALRQRDTPFAVTSPSLLDHLLFQLQKTGMLTAFDVCVGSDEVAEGPPAPALLHEATQRLDVAPDECVTIQSTAVGIEAGHAAGMRVIAVASTADESDLARAHHVVPSLAAISPELLFSE